MTTLDPTLLAAAEEHTAAVATWQAKLGKLMRLDAVRAAPFAGPTYLLIAIDGECMLREPLVVARKLMDLAAAARVITAQIEAKIAEVN